jgi:long-chain acyl-CoA synthetase
VLGNAWWSGDEIVHALATTKPALVLADAGRATLLPPDTDMAGFDQIEAMLDDPTPVPLPAPVVEEDAPAIVLFTSGTTGRAKGAILSHRGVLATLHALLHVTRRLPAADTDLPPPSRALLSLPLFHIGGLQQLVNPMVTGGTLVFTEGRYRPEVAENLLREERIRVWSTVPTMVSRLIAHLEATGATPLDGVRTLGLGGSPVSEELRARVRRWFPEAQRGLAVTYGLSEAGGVVTTGAGTSIRERPGTVGRPLPTTTVRIEEPNERGIGEILVRSPSVMLGYWTDGEPDSGPVRADRWLRTGDIGRLDADGYLYITDRSKDIVIRGGENIATPHVEARILQHPAVAEVAVVGLPHTELGEEVGAVVVPTPGQQVAIEELAAFVAETLAYFEVPSRWLLREEPLPKNVIGKVLKHALRAEWVARDASPDAATAVPAQ